MTTDWAKKLSDVNEFLISTGNLGSWKELQKRTFVCPSDELLECMKLQLKQPDFHENNGILKILSPFSSSEHHIGRYSRDELKITLKTFLSNPNADDVRQCLSEIKKELQVKFVDQLIVAVEHPDNEENDVHPSASSQFLSMWPSLEKMVDEGNVVALGCADLQADDLRRLWDGAKSVKPLVNHYYLSSCCSVPSELKDYAKQHDMVLLTHSDSNPFIDGEQLKSIFDDLSPDFGDHWSIVWVAKYVAMIKSRSVIAGKGYVAKFIKLN